MQKKKHDKTRGKCRMQKKHDKTRYKRRNNISSCHCKSHIRNLNDLFTALLIYRFISILDRK